MALQQANGGREGDRAPDRAVFLYPGRNQERHDALAVLVFPGNGLLPDVHLSTQAFDTLT